MPIDPLTPDLVAVLALDPYAPRSARYHVAAVDSPSPDLRDAVVLLTSEIVTRAVEQGGDAPDATLELRVWMPSDVVRVELIAPPRLLRGRSGLDPRHYDLMLLDCIADRWSVDHRPERACFWFEIDRHPTTPRWGEEDTGAGVDARSEARGDRVGSAR